MSISFSLFFSFLLFLFYELNCRAEQQRWRCETVRRKRVVRWYCPVGTCSGMLQ